MERRKEGSDWLVLLMLVFVSAAVLLVGGFVYFSARPESESRSSRPRLSPLDEAAEGLSSLTPDPPSELGPSGPLGSSGRPSPPDPRDSTSLPRERHSVGEAPRGTDDDDVDWELEMADSEEVEPTPEMIEEERQKIREGRPSFGLVGRPGARLAETLQKRIAERRAERQEQKSGQAAVSPDEDTESSENAVTEASTAGAGTR